MLFFKIADPINLYHAERHILSKPNMEISQPPPTPQPPPPPGPKCMCPSVNSQGNHYPYMDAKKQLLMTTYRHHISTNFGCVLWRAPAVCRVSMACFNHLSISIHIQILQTDLNAFLNPLSPRSDQCQISPYSITFF